MTNVRLAHIGHQNIVQNVIEIPAGNGVEFVTETMGLPGNWFLDLFGEAGPGSLFDPVTGSYSAPDLPTVEQETP